jgi:TPP-dependent trihydroxycyclohexane-1,2-dione (THcHDO) dehydratase
MEGGRITGAITSNDVVRAISRFMDRGQQVSSGKGPQ